MRHHIEFKATTWLWSGGKASWTFVTLPAKAAAEVTLFSQRPSGHKRPGWGSVPVQVRVGQTEWTTSLFPDKKNNSYLLPLKATVRQAEGIETGQTIRVAISIAMP
jgi:Domain of unknown function (DUF1905)